MQVPLWDGACGGWDSVSNNNASNPERCCPLGSACAYYNELYWRCVPDFYTGGYCCVCMLPDRGLRAYEPAGPACVM